MQKKWLRYLRRWLIPSVLCVLLVGWIGSVAWLHWKMNVWQTNMEASIYAIQSQLYSGFADSSAPVSGETEKTNALVTDFGWRMLSADYGNHTVSVELYVVPKDVTETLRVGFTCSADGQVYEVTSERGAHLRYIGKATLPIDTEFLEVQVQFSDAGVIHTEKCTPIYRPGDAYLMHPTVSELGFTSSQQGNKVTFDHPVVFTFGYKRGQGFETRPESAEILVYRNNNLLETRKFALDNADLDEVRDIPAQGDASPFMDFGMFDIQRQFEASYEVAENDRLEVYLKVVDSNGLLYQGKMADLTCFQGRVISNLQEERFGENGEMQLVKE